MVSLVNLVWWLEYENPYYRETRLGAEKQHLGEYEGLGSAKTSRNDVFYHPEPSRMPSDHSASLSQMPSLLIRWGES